MPLYCLLYNIGAKALPRILTQICRDPGSPTWGCCDRNWWHYKVRDFPSVILQQAGYSLSLAADLEFGKGTARELNELAAASCRFWNERAILHGAFEEYYPFEQGYPPAAFSTLAVAKLCAGGVIPRTDIQPGLKVAAGQLLSRFEAEAANQQVAGTAALAVIRSFAPDLVPEADFQRLLQRTLDLQRCEGWFPEYDGPDLGYLSVTIDCLWDLFDASGDERCYAAILSAFDYLSWFVLGPLGSAGMHNSRNTDYIVPYGLTRLACCCQSDSSLNSRVLLVLTKLYTQKEDSTHFLDAVDDRYWCHYIGHSVYRALKLLPALESAAAQSRSSAPLTLPRSMPESGHIFFRGEEGASPDVLVSLRKGAIFTALWPTGQSAADFGWIIHSKKKQHVSHWWSLDWKIFDQDGSVGCEGGMVAHSEHVSTPWKHMVLRSASFLAGSSLIRLLKKIMIFKRGGGSYCFKRRVYCDGAVVVVEDRMTGVGVNDHFVRAPRISKRHVASADSYHSEDLQRLKAVGFSEEISQEGSEVLVITRYQPSPPAESR